MCSAFFLRNALLYFESCMRDGDYIRQQTRIESELTEAVATREVVEAIEATAEFVVFTLIRGGSDPLDYRFYEKRCECLRKHLRTQFDDIAFHEGNLDASAASAISRRFGVRFVNARNFGGFVVPHGLHVPQLRNPGDYSLGYKHMCRFFAQQWFVLLRRYKFAMRVDEDVCIHNMPEDPFEALRRSGAVYGYALLTEEKHAQTVMTMDAWLAAWMRRHSVSEHRRRRLGSVKDNMVFTNIFVSEVSWWSQDPVQRFLRAVEPFIYSLRWGDAPIQSAALRLFAEESQVKFVRVDYTHLSTTNEIRDGVEIPFSGSAGALDAFVPPDFANFLDKAKTQVAPCAVADHYHLHGAPFHNLHDAQEALMAALMIQFNTTLSVASLYSTWELAQAVQFDLFRDLAGPIPDEQVSGLGLRSALAKLVGQPSDDDETLLRRTCKHKCVSCT